MVSLTPPQFLKSSKAMLMAKLSVHLSNATLLERKSVRSGNVVAGAQDGSGSTRCEQREGKCVRSRSFPAACSSRRVLRSPARRCQSRPRPTYHVITNIETVCWSASGPQKIQPMRVTRLVPIVNRQLYKFLFNTFCSLPSFVLLILDASCSGETKRNRQIMLMVVSPRVSRTGAHHSQLGLQTPSIRTPSTKNTK